MTKRSPAAARALAATALICGFLVVIVVIATSLGTGGENRLGGKATGRGAKHGGPAAYVVQNGDTLSSIAHKTGVSVARIQKLNRGIDPQILISGEKLKLR